MGLTQHAHGVATVKALVNVALARGLPCRPNAGLVPIRGHSGVQGGAEVGCQPRVTPEARARWSAIWGFPVPDVRAGPHRKWSAHAADGDVDLFWMVGGNFLETIGDEARSRRALARPDCASIRTSSLSSAMLVDSEGDVAAASGHDSLRVAGWRHRDVYRTSDHLLAGNPGPANRLGEAGVVGLSRRDGSRTTGSATARGPGRCAQRSARRSRAPCHGMRDRNASRQRRSGAVGRPPPLR